MIIAKFYVRRLFAAMPSARALAAIESAACTHGFEITETVDLDAFANGQTGTNLNHRIALMQMHKPAMTLGKALLDDTMPLIPPLRVIVCEVDNDSSVINFQAGILCETPKQSMHSIA